MEFERMLRYTAALEENNDRTWFHANHKWYEDAKRDYLNLLDLMRFAIVESAPTLRDDLLYMEPKDWMYRVARDMRLHKNGLPYTPSFRAYLSPDRKSWRPIGYYFRLAAYGSIFGTGLHVQDSREIDNVRHYISAHAWELAALVMEAQVNLVGETLRRMPRGFDPEDPAAEWIKMKSWNAMVDVPPEKLTDFETFDAYIRDSVRRLEPLRQFFLRASARHELSESEQVRRFYQSMDE